MSTSENTRRVPGVRVILSTVFASAMVLIVPVTAQAAEVRSGDTVTIGRTR